MFDAFGLPAPTEDGRTQWFVNTSTGAPGSVKPASSVWLKPKGVSFVQIFAIGAGGQGGAGATRSANSPGGGGGGGGSASAHTSIWLARMLPDALYIHAGSTNSGFLSGVSYVMTYDNNTSSPAAQSLLALSGDLSNPAGAGGTGTASLVGTGGADGIIANVVMQPLVHLSLTFKSTAGQAGGAGGAVAGGNGSNVTLSGAIASAGAGGGGTTNANFAGGNITGAASSMQITNNGGAAGGGIGSNGFLFPAAVSGYGGSGGGSSNTGAGGMGGAGAVYGAGGGGGGAGTTGGLGGDGGPGLVVIHCW